ncbi:MAG: hypothetical protein OXU61_12390 [Gammaproteobacteria bacterium]|nr:hypothetical protein [Gammaproteobacteria bacterium]
MRGPAWHDSFAAGAGTGRPGAGRARILCEGGNKARDSALTLGPSPKGRGKRGRGALFPLSLRERVGVRAKSGANEYSGTLVQYPGEEQGWTRKKS